MIQRRTFLQSLAAFFALSAGSRLHEPTLAELDAELDEIGVPDGPIPAPICARCEGPMVVVRVEPSRAIGAFGDSGPDDGLHLVCPKCDTLYGADSPSGGLVGVVEQLNTRYRASRMRS